MKCIVLLFCIVFSLKSFSQEDELYDYNWRLYSLNISGQNYSPPSNEEVSNVVLGFSSNPDVLFTSVCNSLEGELVFDNTNISFTFPNGISTSSIECNNSENSIFEGHYFNFFNDNIDNPFSYSLGHADFPEWWYLVIRSENGDSASYEWYTLSTNDNSIENVTLHPNPVETNFYISTISNLDNITVTIYSISGKLILSEVYKKSGDSINVQNLKSGIYFVSIRDEKGNTSLKKIVKN